MPSKDDSGASGAQGAGSGAVQNDASPSLLEQAQQGNHRAFALLIAPFETHIYSVACRYTRNEEDAEDVYQEVFIKAWKAIRTFEERSHFGTWLTRIAVTTGCDMYAKRKRKEAVELRQEISDDLTNNMGERQWPLLPEEALTNALSALTPKERLVFLLKHQEGYKLSEIATTLGVAEGTVKRYLSDALFRLRRALGPYRQW